MRLRTDQRNAVDHVLHSDKRSILVVAPTGTGKTDVYAEIARQFAAQGKRVLVLAHRGEILEHGAARLQSRGLAVGIIRAGFRHLEDASATIQVASIQTLCRRKRRPRADVVIVDEAHHSPAKSYRKVLENYPRARVVGLTATPVHATRSLADCFDEMHTMIELADAVDRGVLAPVTGKVWLRKIPGLDTVKKVGGDFDAARLGQIMSQRAIVGGIVANWKRHAAGKSTIVFAATLRQAMKVTRAFQKAGVRAEYLDGSARRERRADVLERFNAGEFPVLCNVELFTEGVNVPRAKCIVLARPTYSVTKFLQMVGRGRRPWNGEACTVHDHAGIIGTHGHPDDKRDWRLGGKSDKTYVTCPNGHVRRADVPKCPEGCSFPGHGGRQDPAFVLRGYRYDLEEFSRERASKVEEARRLHVDERQSLSQVAARVKVPLGTIYAIGKRAGWVRSVSDRDDPRVVEEARRLYVDLRIPSSQVAKTIGKSKAVIQRYAKAYGWPITGSRIQPPADPKIIRQILRLAKRDRALEDIARAIGYHENSVRRLLGENGIRVETRAEAARRRRKARAVALRASGLKLREIARRLHVSVPRVSTWVTERT